MQQPANRKKILIVVPTLECGGLERNVSIICNNIDSALYDVTLAVLNNERPFFQITNAGVTLLNLHVRNVRKSLFRILKLSREIKPDIILTTANHLNLYFSIFKWMFPRRIKIIARESSIVSINNKHAKMPALYERLVKMFYRKLDLIVCQSVYMQEDLIRNYFIPPSKTLVISNAVSSPVTTAGTNAAGPHRLITVARLSGEKGIDRLIRAVSLLDIPFEFTIIGDGNLKEKLQQLVSDLLLQQKVFFAGNRQQPFAVVPDPHLFLMGSHYEGFPNAMLEALAAGIPVVAFNAPGGIAELIKDHENGILVEGGDERQFANAIKEALASGFDKKQIRELTLEQYNIQAIMKKWYALFDQP